MNKIIPFTKKIANPLISSRLDVRYFSHIVKNNNHNIKSKINHYLDFIETQKNKLKESNIQFTERKVTASSSNTRSILIYHSSMNKTMLNNKIIDETASTKNKKYSCGNFSLAVVKGVDPEEFSSADMVKNHPELSEHHFESFYYKIPKSAYYIDSDDFLVVLKEIANSVYNQPENNSQNFLLISTNHALGLMVKKQDNILHIKYYDPATITNCTKEFLLYQADDIKYLYEYDFFSFVDKISYFSQGVVALLNAESTTTNKNAQVKILGDINPTKLGFLLLFGHYQSNLIKNTNILDSTIYNENYPILEFLRLLQLLMPSLFKHIPGFYFYNKVPGFCLACKYNHVEAITAYINDILDLPISIIRKLKVFIHNKTSPLTNSMLNNESDVWQIFVNAVLEHKNLSSKDKISLLGVLTNVSNLFILAFYSDDREDEYAKHRLKLFDHYLTNVLAANTLSEPEKIHLIATGDDSIKDLLCIKYFFAEQIQFEFLSCYLEKILTSSYITNTTKIHLLDFKVSTAKKEELLYHKAIDSGDYNFIFCYIKEIINSSLTLKDKQYLLNIEDSNLCNSILTELKKTHPDIAKLCISIIPSYKKCVK